MDVQCVPSGTKGVTRRSLLGGGVAIIAGLGPQKRAHANTPKSGGPARAEVNHTLTARFRRFGDRRGGWTGADSAYSVSLPGNRVVWLYSDTFLGKVNSDRSRPEDSPFIHNSLILASPSGDMRTVTGGTPRSPKSLIAPHKGDDSETWYWVGDGVMEYGTLAVLILQFKRTGDGPLDFEYVRSGIASLHPPTFKVTSVTLRKTSSETDSVQWASAILSERHYTYIYGIEDKGAKKHVHLARVVKHGLSRGSAWQYWTGVRWSHQETDSARIASDVSNEFSVSRHGNGYSLITNDAREQWSPDIMVYDSYSPEGPFSNQRLLYRAPEKKGDVYAYNAKAHPELKPRAGRMVVTYNVNSLDQDDIYKDVDLYRPRYMNISV